MRLALETYSSALVTRQALAQRSSCITVSLGPGTELLAWLAIKNSQEAWLPCDTPHFKLQLELDECARMK